MLEKNDLLQKRNNNLETEIQNYREDYVSLEKLKDDISDRVQNQNDYVIQMEEKIFKSNKISLELLKQLKDAEVEIECLKQYTADLKGRVAVYIPVPDDALDKRLADYINNYPDAKKLRLMFTRDQHGVYQFGTRKVQMKLESN
jgi:hypothetical protein